MSANRGMEGCKGTRVHSDQYNEAHGHELGGCFMESIFGKSGVTSSGRIQSNSLIFL